MANWGRSLRGWSRGVAALGVLTVCVLATGTAGAQNVPLGQSPATGRAQPRSGLDASGAADAPNPLGGSNATKLEHMREDERHKRLESDMAKLVELTNELKTEVDKATKDELSLDVVRKAAEIEKLAHDVKERMKS